MSIALVIGLLLTSKLALGDARCLTDNEIESGADRAEDLALEFVRAYGRSAGLTDLRKLPPSPREMHVRLWLTFAHTGVKGLVLNRRDQLWTSYVVTHANSGCYELREVSAVSNWTQIWEGVESAGLATLPSNPTRDAGVVVADGYSYVLEWWVDGRYRTFVYDNPDFFMTREDARMIAIARQLLGAAGIKTPEKRRLTHRLSGPA